MLTSMDRPAVKFREDIWKYNRALSFTSLGVHEDRSVNKGNGPPVFRISGELHHLSGALTPSEGHLPRYAQLYVYDSQAALDSRMDQNEGLDKGTMGLLQQMLLDHHQYVPLYKQAFEILREYDPSNDVDVQKRGLPHVHILIFLKEPHKLLTPEAIDSSISARWPDPVTEPALFQTVKNCMV